MPVDGYQSDIAMIFQFRDYLFHCHHCHKFIDAKLHVSTNVRHKCMECNGDPVAVGVDRLSQWPTDPAAGLAPIPAQPPPVVGPAGHAQLYVIFYWIQVDVYIIEDLKDIFQGLLVKKQFMISKVKSPEIWNTFTPPPISRFCSNVLYYVPPTHVVKFCLLYSGYSSLSQLVSQFNITFFNFADLTQLQTTNTQAKYCEILPAHIKTTHDTTHKIAN